MDQVGPLEILTWTELSAEERARMMARGDAAGSDDEGLRKSIAGLVADVVARGDDALVDALARFDGVQVTPDGLRVTAKEFTQAREDVSEGLLAAIRTAIARIRAFNEQIVERSSWMVDTGDGRVGEKASPIDSVGLFVPAGKGSFPSVLTHIATPAMVAGVPRVQLIVPPMPDGSGRIDPATLVVAQELGIEDVFRVNGPSGIAALAYGTATIPKVSKIVGPGSRAVTYAQMEAQRHGCVVEVGIGPSDSLIVADDSADPRLLAADLINEAEHGMDSSAVLVATDRAVLNAAALETRRQLAELPEKSRRNAYSSIARNGGLVFAASRAEAMAIANEYAPEHLQLAVTDPEAWLPDVVHSGTVLLGQTTPFSASNFGIGTPATLPTTGFARVTSGVTAHTYLTRVAVAELRQEGYEQLAPVIVEFARYEGFPAHVASVTARSGPLSELLR